MSKSFKIAVFVASGFAGLLVLVAVALLLFVDVNAHKPQLEAAASEALGMEFTVAGRLGLGFFPSLHITLDDTLIRNRSSNLASAKQTRLGIELLPLLHNEIRIESIALNHATIFIVRDPNGKFNFEKPDDAKGTLAVLDMAAVSVSDGTFLYADKHSKVRFEARDCNLALRRLHLSGGESTEFLKNLSFTAKLSCGKGQKKDLAVSNLKISAAAKDGVYDFKPVSMRAFGGQGSGNMRINCSGAIRLYHVSYKLSQFHIEEFFKTLSPKKVAVGKMDFSANLSMQGNTVNKMKRTANGEMSLNGKNLTLDGTDLDAEFARYESSQNFNLVDLGAFFFAGPFGLAVTKGYNFASIFQESEGSSEIRTLVSNWKVARGVAQAKDVAMATKENRVALQGKLDFVNERFDNVTVALIDAAGCTKVRQKILGPFQKPVVEQPNILMSLMGPALRLLKRGRDLFPGGECEVFYAGAVAPPN